MVGSGICSATEIIVHSGESIQAALDNSTEGDTIIVEPGTYDEDLTIYHSYTTVKSSSGNVNTIITGSISASDLYSYPINGALIDGLTLDGGNNWVGVLTWEFEACTVQNSKIIHYETGLAALSGAVISAINTQFIECGTGLLGDVRTGISAENCQFIDCGVAISPGGGPDASYSSKNNVEIHTDASGNQVTTPIPDEERGYGYPEETPTEPVVTPTPDPVVTPTVPLPEPVAIPAEAPTEIPSEAPVETTTEAPIEDTSSHSSGGSSHSSGGGGGGSPEPASNVQVKDTSKVYIQNDKPVTFNFTNHVTTVESIRFTSKKTMGKTTAIAEDLKNQSTLTANLPEGVVYKLFNVWVGNAGYGTSDNIHNASVNFRVNKTWMQENDITAVSLYEYDKEWEKLQTTQVNEDEEFLYFTADVKGFSSFVIIGKSTQRVQEDEKITAENRAVGDMPEGTETESTESNPKGNTLLSIGIVTGALLVGGFIMKSMKK